MDGVKLSKLSIIEHPKGNIMHGIKSSSDGFNGFGEVYFSNVKYREIKGWKMHKKMYLNLVVPIGAVKFVIYNGSNFFEVILSIDNYYRLTVSPKLWVGFQGISKKQNLVMNIANIEHDQNEACNCELNHVPYEWLP